MVKDDRKIRIATGSGIEDILTNEDCQHIIDDNIIPNFKNKDYYKGLNEALDIAMKTLSPELFPAANTPAALSNDIPSSSGIQSYSYNPNEVNNTPSVLPFIILIVIVIVIVMGIVKMFGNSNTDNRIYNADGAYSSSYYNRRRGLGWFFSGLFLGGFFNNRNSSNYDNNNRYFDSGSSNNNFESGSSNNFGSSDSFSSSSSDSGSSFGGGSSDGGGASGSW